MSEASARELVAEVERRLERVEALGDQEAIAVTQALLDLYGAGLERIVEEVAARDDDGELARALAGDELVSHLLLLHGLHPVAVGERVQAALDGVRPYLDSHGGDVELLAVEGPAVRLRLQGSCSGCPSSAMTLKLAIEDAIHQAAPEIEEVIAEDSEPADAPLLQIELAPAMAPEAAWAMAPEAAMAPKAAWAMAGGLPELSGGGLVAKRVAGQPILFASVDGRLYGYRPRCPACEASLHDAALRDGELRCAGCGRRYDVPHAGRGLDSPDVHLEPVPLLVSGDGLVKIALPAPA